MNEDEFEAPITWGIVMTVREPVALVLSVIAYHLEAGASEIHLYLDEDDPALRAHLHSRADVYVTVCDAAYWAARKDAIRPRKTVERQCVNANDAYRRARVDWLLHSDADEYIADGAKLVAELSALDQKVDCLRIPNIERVFVRGQPRKRVFEGPFRRSRYRFRWLGPLIFGKSAPFLNGGLTGYTIGKTISRVGRGLTIRVHGAVRPGKGVTWATARKALLLHFDAITPLYLQSKLARRAQILRDGIVLKLAPSRLRFIAELQKRADDPVAFEELVQATTSISHGQYRILRLLQMARDVKINPEDSLARVFPDAPPLTEAALDSDLLERYGALPGARGRSQSGGCQNAAD